jgi:hypothetical protein
VLNEEKPKTPSGKKQNQNTLDMAGVVRDDPTTGIPVVF